MLTYVDKLMNVSVHFSWHLFKKRAQFSEFCSLSFFSALSVWFCLSSFMCHVVCLGRTDLNSALKVWKAALSTAHQAPHNRVKALSCPCLAWLEKQGEYITLAGSRCPGNTAGAQETTTALSLLSVLFVSLSFLCLSILLFPLSDSLSWCMCCVVIK